MYFIKFTLPLRVMGNVVLAHRPDDRLGFLLLFLQIWPPFVIIATQNMFTIHIQIWIQIIFFPYFCLFQDKIYLNIQKTRNIYLRQCLTNWQVYFCFTLINQLSKSFLNNLTNKFFIDSEHNTYTIYNIQK